MKRALHLITATSSLWFSSRRTRLMITFGLATGLWLALAMHASAQGVIQFAKTSYSAGEGTGTAILVVRCDGATNEVSVHYATVDGTATNGVDYLATNGTLTFTLSQTNQSIMVPILNDGLPRASRSFQVQLSEATEGSVLGASSNALVTISDNDSGVAFPLSAYTVAEDAGTFLLGVARSDDNDNPVSVDVTTVDVTALSGVDYVGVTNTVRFSSNNTLAGLRITILNNGSRDGNRTFRTSLSNPVGLKLGSPVTATVTIVDDDQGFRLGSSTNAVSEDAGFALVKVLRGVAPSGSAATVDYATANLIAISGTDYTAVSGTLDFAAGELEKYVKIPILNDGLRESSKTFSLYLTNASAGELLASPASTTIAIYDNDPGVSFAVSRMTNAWGSLEVSLPVIRGSDQLMGAFSVSYATADSTAKAGTDYEAASGTLDFAADETVKHVTVRLLSSRAVGGSKSFTVSLSNPTGGLVLGAGAVATVQIADSYAWLGAPFDSDLRAEAEAGLHFLTWKGAGQLERSDRVDGPWQPLVSARSPWVIPVSAPAAFYRVKNPRPAMLYVPASYDGTTPMPLVIALHGYTGSGAGQEDYLRLRPLAESRGFLYCYPDGTLDQYGQRFWCMDLANADEASMLGIPFVDDLGYLRGLIGDITQRFAVDRKRVYFVGHSNGGYMSHWMAFNCADLIAGIATLAGTVPALPIKTPSQPVNVLHIHGTADSSVLYADSIGSYPNGSRGVLFGGAMHTITQWAEYNGATGCVGDPFPTLDLDQSISGLDTTVTRYANSPPGGAVELWTINGGGHTPALSAQFSPKVIDWLLAHPKP